MATCDSLKKIYIGQTGLRLEFDTEYDVANIASATIRYQKADTDSTKGTWAAQIGTGTVVYKDDFVADDLDTAGDWFMQPVITNTDGKTIPCKIVKVTVYEKI